MATARYSANADAFLLAVQELAGRDAASGLDVVDKARKAVSMVKVLQALQSILDMLQVGGRAGEWLGRWGSSTGVVCWQRAGAGAGAGGWAGRSGPARGCV